jgi:hypothetical protein
MSYPRPPGNKLATTYNDKVQKAIRESKLSSQNTEYRSPMVRQPSPARNVYLGICVLSGFILLLMIYVIESNSYPSEYYWLCLIPLIPGGLSYWGFLYTWKQDTLSASQEMERLHSKSSPNMNRFVARKETKASAARTDLGRQLVEEGKVVINKVDQQLELQRKESERKYFDRRMEELRQAETAANETIVAKNYYEQNLMNEAASYGRTVETDQRLKIEAGQAQIEIEKIKQLKYVEDESRWKLIQQDLDAANRAELTPYELIQILTEGHLFKMMERYDEIQRTERSPWVKEQKLQRLKKNIDKLQEIIDDKQARLLPDQDRPQVNGTEQTPNGGTGRPEATQRTQEQPPAQEPRNRTGRGNRY